MRNKPMFWKLRFTSEIFPGPAQTSTIYVAKTKALISFLVTAKLMCVFVFAYAKCWFSHDAAQIFFDNLEIDLHISP